MGNPFSEMQPVLIAATRLPVADDSSERRSVRRKSGFIIYPLPGQKKFLVF